MTKLNLKSTTLSVITLLIFSLITNVATAQNVQDTSHGIKITSQKTNSSKFEMYSKTNKFMGGLFSSSFGLGHNVTGFVDSNKSYAFEHSTLKFTKFLIGGRLKMMIYNDGKVVIGDDLNLQYTGSTPNATKTNVISSDDYKLIVDKGILTEKVKIAGLTTDDWADYVFEEDYELMPINKLEGFIAENKHLPNVPSAEEVAENGLDIAKTNATLLEKIEESLLYIIELNNKVNVLEAELETVKNGTPSQN